MTITSMPTVHPINKHLESGDRLGFGIVYPAVKNQPGDRGCQVIIVYCTINGNIIYHKALEQAAGGFYPVVCLFKYGKCRFITGFGSRWELGPFAIENSGSLEQATSHSFSNTIKGAWSDFSIWKFLFK